MNLTLVDFVKENSQLVLEWNQYYDYNETQEDLIESAKNNNLNFDANSEGEYVFGDESGTLVGKIFDYILRDGGESENFKWKFYQYYR